jgi:hypothetical protein
MATTEIEDDVDGGTPRDRVVLSPEIRVLYSAILFAALNSRCTMYLNYSPSGVRSRAPALPPTYVRNH